MESFSCNTHTRFSESKGEGTEILQELPVWAVGRGGVSGGSWLIRGDRWSAEGESGDGSLIHKGQQSVRLETRGWTGQGDGRR